MNYKKLVLLGLVGSSAMFLPGCNMLGSVYGPPPPDVVQQQAEYEAECASELDSEAGSEFDPSLNELREVYGPPVEEWDVDEAEEDAGQLDSSDKSDQADASDKSDKPASSDKSDQTDASDKTDQTDASEKNDTDDESGTVPNTPSISDNSKFEPKANMIPSVYGPPPAQVKSADDLKSDDSEVMK